MPRGENPNSRSNLKRFSSIEARKNGSKGGKISGVSRRNYACLRESFKAKLTDDMANKMFDRLWSLFINHNNLHALGKIIDILGDDANESESEQSIVIVFQNDTNENQS